MKDPGLRELGIDHSSLRQSNHVRIVCIPRLLLLGSIIDCHYCLTVRRRRSGQPNQHAADLRHVYHHDLHGDNHRFRVFPILTR